MVDELDVPEEGLLGSRISRRKVLIGAGVVGGTVWVAPVIDSFTSAAAAASEPITSSCNGATCANLTSCNGNDSCYCYERAGTFTGVCETSQACAGLTACTTQSDCPSGTTCVVNTCCGAAGVCIVYTGDCLPDPQGNSSPRAKSNTQAAAGSEGLWTAGVPG